MDIIYIYLNQQLTKKEETGSKMSIVPTLNFLSRSTGCCSDLLIEIQVEFSLGPARITKLLSAFLSFFISTALFFFPFTHILFNPIVFPDYQSHCRKTFFFCLAFKVTGKDLTARWFSMVWIIPAADGSCLFCWAQQ